MMRRAATFVSRSTLQAGKRMGTHQVCNTTQIGREYGGATRQMFTSLFSHQNSSSLRLPYAHFKGDCFIHIYKNKNKTKRIQKYNKKD